MAGERIDIVVSETGSTQAAGNIAAIGAAADKTAAQVDKAKAGYGTLSATVTASLTPLQVTAAAADKATQSFGALAPAVAAAETNLKTVGKTAGTETKPAVDGLSTAMRLLSVAIGAITFERVIASYVQAADTFQSIVNRLRLVSRSSAELVKTEQELFDMSNRTRSSFEATSNLYLKLAQNASALGVDQKSLIPTLETINQLISLSGATSAEATAGLLQFSQGLASNRFQGDELRSVLENLPALGQAIAKGLNVTTGQLREMGEQGQLTAKLILDAISKQAPEIAKQFASVTPTIGGAFQVLKNNALQLIGVFDQVSGASNAVANVIQLIAQNLGALVKVVALATFTIGSYYAALAVQSGWAVFMGGITAATSALRAHIAFAAAAGTQIGILNRIMLLSIAPINAVRDAFVALWAVIRANPFTVIVTLIGAAVAALYLFGNAIKLNSDGSITALGAVVGILTTLWDYMKQIGAWVSQVFSPIWTFFGNLVQEVWTTFLNAVRGVFNFLSQFIPQLQGVNAQLDTFLKKLVDNMKAASKSLGDASLASKDFGQNLGGALDGASAAAGKLATAVQLSGDGMTQLGRVVASAIPPFENLVRAAERAKEAQEEMQRILVRLRSELTEYRRELERTALQTRNAFGQMVTATDEWARRSGAAFNAVAGQAASVADATTDSMNQIVQAAQAASSALSSVQSSADATFVASTQEQSTYLRQAGASDGMIQQLLGAVNNFWQAQGTGRGAYALTQLSNLLSQVSPQVAQVVLANNPGIKAFLQGAGLPTFANGGSFMVGGSGGTDSQLVSFMASPDERVTVETPAQRRRSDGVVAGSSQRPVVINMTVNTPDANSFRRSKNQTYLQLKSKLAGV